MTVDWDVGTDIGGTFTDIVAVHAATGETRTAKVPSRPDAPVDAMLEALAAIGLDGPALRRFVHGTTRVTNAIVQDRLPPIAPVATAGFSDVPTTCVERALVPPYGLCGGAPGQPYRITLDRGGRGDPLPGKANLVLRQGDLVTIETSGGGGYG